MGQYVDDGVADSEVGLSSYAYQEWAYATKDNPALRNKIEALNPRHHDLVLAGVKKTREEDYIALTGGQRGRPKSTRRRVREALKRRLHPFAGNSLNVWIGVELMAALACVCALNSFVVNWRLRQSVSANMDMFYLHLRPVPRLSRGDRFFDAIVPRAAHLICTAPA